jgi:hypothetical protein
MEKAGKVNTKLVRNLYVYKNYDIPRLIINSFIQLIYIL